jgi:hypothetical protein
VRDAASRAVILWAADSWLAVHRSSSGPCREVRWPYMSPVPAVRKRMFLDARTATSAKNMIEVGPRRSGNAAGGDPPPSWSFRGTDVEPGEHDYAGLRVELAAAFQ